MNYTPTIWSNGMKITAARLNKLENGINSGSPTVLVISDHDTETVGESEIDYNFNQIKNIYLSGRNIYLFEGETNYEYYKLIGGIASYASENSYIMLDSINEYAGAYGASDPNTNLI